MIIDQTGSLKAGWLANSKLNQPVLEKHGRPLTRVDSKYMRAPVLIAGGGATLGWGNIPNMINAVIGNQSSAPYLAFHGERVDMTVIIDGGIAVFHRIKYMIAKKIPTTYIVATHIHPRVLKAIVKTGNDIEFFIHHSTEDTDFTNKLMGDWDNYKGSIPCIAQMGSVVNASVAVSALKFPKVPMVFSGVDFGYPIPRRDRVESVTKGIYGNWETHEEKETGPRLKVYGYETSAQHVEYYQQFKMLVDKLKKDHQFYVVGESILRKDLGFRDYA